MREIKFRVWDTKANSFLENTDEFTYLKLNDIFKEEDLVFQQYTGLKDKNGKEIYEGDIIKYTNKLNYTDIGVIEFFACMFICSWKDQTDDELGYMLFNNIEVIGNIFENP